MSGMVDDDDDDCTAGRAVCVKGVDIVRVFEKGRETDMAALVRRRRCMLTRTWKAALLQKAKKKKTGDGLGVHL